MVAQVYGETIEKEMKQPGNKKHACAATNVPFASRLLSPFESLRQYKKIREEQIAKKKAQEEALGIAVVSSSTKLEDTTGQCCSALLRPKAF